MWSSWESPETLEPHSCTGACIPMQHFCKGLRQRPAIHGWSSSRLGDSMLHRSSWSSLMLTTKTVRLDLPRVFAEQGSESVRRRYQVLIFGCLAVVLVPEEDWWTQAFRCNSRIFLNGGYNWLWKPNLHNSIKHSKPVQHPLQS